MSIFIEGKILTCPQCGSVEIEVDNDPDEFIFGSDSKDTYLCKKIGCNRKFDSEEAQAVLNNPGFDHFGF